MNRREFLRAGAGAALAAVASPLAVLSAEQSFSFGLITDLHYAKIPTKGRRHYADSLGKLRQAVDSFTQRGLPLAIQLGDLIDKGPAKTDDLDYLKSMREAFELFPGQRRFVLGNHCLATLTREEFLTGWATRGAKTYYSFDLGAYHFVVLDADYKRDGTPYRAGNFHWTDSWIPEAQQRWLAADLRQAVSRKAIVLVHQNLQDQSKPWGVKNADAVRKILESAGNVRAVFQGHLHEGFYGRIAGIPYCTLKAAVEGPGLDNAYAIVTLGPGNRISLQGFGRQPNVSFAM
jgi:hypothetical protein